MTKIYDFSGYATKNDLKCSDGRTIRKDAFKENDGATVPLVWQHNHSDPANILGHAILENRVDGVYARCVLNDTPSGENAKKLVAHGDITALSIYANKLVQKASDVIHGTIREVSLVLAGANPGALIDNLTIAHSDGTYSDAEDEAIIYSGIDITLGEEAPDVKHADSTTSTESTETVGDIFDTLSDKQKDVVYALMAELMLDKADEADAVQQSAMDDSKNNGGTNFMKENVFEKQGVVGNKKQTLALSHDEFQLILADAKETGSFKKSFLAHIAPTYGIENIDYLFPDARTVTPTPEIVKRDMEWVSVVMNGTRHSPFSRIKSLSADLTADEARAKGYVTGAQKFDEVFGLLKRTTGPTTIYKKQKLDRDDILDITDMDVVAWLKMEMRMMLDEEVARAILIGDGRTLISADKIDETCIRPIYSDADLYVYREVMDFADETEDVIDAVVRARINYKGSGVPTLFATSGLLTEMLLIKDSLGHRIYSTEPELKAALRVSSIVEVPVMDNVSRILGADTLNLKGIIVNLSDYTVGADKGAAIGMFDDFDIDYNQYKYLLETRISGALTKPKSAIIIEQKAA